VLPDFIRLAKVDTSGLVRLALASTLQRLPVSQRAGLAAALLARKTDANDHNLPLLIWYGLIPVADDDPAMLVPLAATSELPLTRKFIARRLAEDIEKNCAPLNDLLKLSASKPAAFQADILEGMTDGLIGWRKAKKPAAWDALATKLANQAWEALFRAQSTIIQELSARDAWETLVPREYGVLYALSSAPEGLRITELGEDVLLTQPGMSRLVGRLEARGLVRRVDDPQDARACRIRLTPAGLATQRRIGRTHARHVAEAMTRNLDRRELEQLLDLCRSLI